MRFKIIRNKSILYSEVVNFEYDRHFFLTPAWKVNFSVISVVLATDSVKEKRRLGK